PSPFASSRVFILCSVPLKRCPARRQPPPSFRSVPQRPIQSARSALVQEQRTDPREQKGRSTCFFPKSHCNPQTRRYNPSLSKFSFHESKLRHRQRPHCNASDRAARGTERHRGMTPEVGAVRDLRSPFLAGVPDEARARHPHPAASAAALG